jgi:hypothetical protein
MYITNKSRSTKLSYILLNLFFLTFFIPLAAAVDLPFDPNLYDFLIYVPEGEQDSIEEAMEYILDRQLDQSEIRSYTNPVTSSDLATHDILIVGWNVNGYTSGLDDETLAAGITGRVLLTGHDADFHTVYGPQAAEVFLVQAIDWVLKGGGTGLITLGCTDAFPYLPEFWDVNVSIDTDGGEDVTEFTEEGLASDVYDGLVPDNMSYWNTAYHDIFTIEQGSFFVPFELGGYDGNDIITIASYKLKLPYFDIKKDANGVNCVSPLISQAEHEFMGDPYNWLYYNIDCNAIGYADTNVIITT